MASETTQPASGATRPESGVLDPAALFTLEEAAGRVRVPVEDLEARCDRGELLFETRRRGRVDVRCVRGRDLAEAFPGAPGAQRSAQMPAARPRPRSAAAAQPSVRPSAAATPVPRASAAEPDGIAEAVRGSGASRDALIGLCQDLEIRLDLAERERQASTASLLMAQRRVLDLELQGRSRPWVRAGGAMLGFMSISALAVLTMIPGWLDQRAGERQDSLRTELVDELGQLEASMGALVASSELERTTLSARLASSASALEEERLRIEQLVAAAEVERARAGEARLAGLAQLGVFEERLANADRQAVRRGAELGVMVDSSARDRARFDERLAAAERATSAARAALTAAQQGAAEERETFEGQLALVASERAAEHASRTTEIEDLRGELGAIVTELQSSQAASLAALEAARAELKAQREALEPVEVWTLTNGGRETWWSRTLRSMASR